MQVKGSANAACLPDDTAAAPSAQRGAALRWDGFGATTPRPLVGALAQSFTCAPAHLHRIVQTDQARGET